MTDEIDASDATPGSHRSPAGAESRSLSTTRRTFLGAAGAAALAATAGCSDAFGGADPPDYAGAVPADDGDGVFAVHIDAEWLRTDDGDRPYEDELPDAVDPELSVDGTAATVDPLVGYPVGGLFVASVAISFGVLPYGFGDDLLAPFGDDLPDDGDDAAAEADNGTDDDDEPSEEAADADGEVRIDSMLAAEGVGVFRGSFDGRTLVAQSDDFELTEERGEFEVYEGTESGLLSTEGLSFAVADDVVVLTLNEDADFDAVLDVVGGDESGVTADEDAVWTLATAGEGHLTLGVWGTDPDEAADESVLEGGETLDAASGLVSSLTLGPEEGAATLAAVYPDGEAPEQAAVENDIGTSASTRDIELDGNRLTVDGRWRVPEDD